MKSSFQFVLVFLVQSLATLLIGVPAFAGWSSGGGELIKDARNPWFLNNTADVNYCVSIDSQNFGVTREVFVEKLQQAIQYWHKEFQFVTFSTYKRLGELKIASQNFHEVACSDSGVDIRFQLGVLDAEQRAYLKDPTQFAAITVRTNYEEKSLRGKGFIYLSPGQGDLAYNSTDTLPNAWAVQQNQLLYLTLVHELGHVFGLPHMGSALGEIMAEGFVETILAKNNEPVDYASAPHLFSLPTKSPVFCPDRSSIKKWSRFFELSTAEKCIQFIFIHDDQNQLYGDTKIKIYASASKSGPQRLVADTDVSMYRFNPQYINLIWLPEGQEVFEPSELIQIGKPAVLGTSLLSVSKSGRFTTANKRLKRRLTVRFEQGKSAASIDGVDEKGDIIIFL